MRTLRNTLYFSLTLQICLAAAIIAAAEEAPLGLVTIPLALGSLIVIDLLGWIRPPRLLLNLAALASVGFAIMEFSRQSPEEGRLNQLLAGGHLIVYLTWTFLLQVKDLRRMWWMFALSVLQVALGAVLTNEPWFGAAMFVYTASAIWTMSLLSLTRAALLADSRLLSSEGEDSVSRSAVDAPLTRQSFATNGVRTDEQGRWVSPRFAGGGAVTFFLILIVGMTFFVFTPRIWIGDMNVLGRSSRGGVKGTTGFTESVKLGDIGQIMESDELVMEITVLDWATEKRIPPPEFAAAVGDEPLLRGTVLENYNAGIWEKRTYDGWRQSYDFRRQDQDHFNLVRLNITLQPIDTDVLFYTGQVLGAIGVMSPEAIVYHPFTIALERDSTYSPDTSQPYSYTVSTTPFSVRPNQALRDQRKAEQRRLGFPDVMRPLLQTPCERLSKLAREVLDKSGKEGDPDSESTARVLEEYLRDSNEYHYSMDLSVEDATIDPVEDFVFNRKQGHCEYFASALALMLRGVGIPARLISGFKGAEYNDKTRNLEVRALHAHAWVEAYVDGGWVTLDPTPGERNTEVAAKAKDISPDLIHKSRSLWFQSMDYSKSQQDALVYAPLRNVGEMIRRNFTGLMQGEFPLLTPLKNLFMSPRQWFSGAGVAVALILLSLIAGAVWLSRKLFSRWKGWTRARDLAQRRAITVEFYARLLKLLQRFGQADIETLTPREFAHRAEQQFQSRFRTAGIAGTTLALVETFYSVRFGHQPLSTDQLQVVEQQLGQLERSLGQTA